MAKSVKSAKSMDSPGSPSLCSRSSLVFLSLGGCLLLLIFSGCGHRAEISGAINTTDFMIPSGDVITAVADTTISASRKIQIDGTLYLAPGANVTFVSPSVTVTGRVQNLAMHAGWWPRTRSILNSIPSTIATRIDRMLGRQPKYLARGSVDCLSPQSAAVPPLNSNSPGKGPRRPGWRRRQPPS